MSNNGSQHLSALTKDETTAPLVNLVPLDLPGDLYKYVADHVWAKIDAIVDKMPKQKRVEAEELIDTLTRMKKQIGMAPAKSEQRKTLITKLLAFKASRGDLIKEAAPVFWSRITDSKHRRKVVKR
jgi:DNA-directed RNA polymerase